MIRPYIAVTGMAEKAEVSLVTKLLPIPPSRLTVMGVLASFETLTSSPNRWNHPPIDSIESLLPQHKDIHGFIHFEAGQGDLINELLTLAEFGVPNLKGFILDAGWADPSALEKFRAACPKKKLIVKLGQKAIQEVNGSPSKLALKVANEYGEYVDGFLLDINGLGQTPVREYLQEIHKQYLTRVNFGISGLGLSDLKRIQPLIKDFPSLSLEAGQRLYNEIEMLDLNQVGRFLLEAQLLFREQQKTRLALVRS